MRKTFTHFLSFALVVIGLVQSSIICAADMKLHYTFQSVTGSTVNDDSGSYNGTLLNGAFVEDTPAGKILNLGLNDGYLEAAQIAPLVQTLEDFSVVINVCLDEQDNGTFLWSFSDSYLAGGDNGKYSAFLHRFSRYGYTEAGWSHEKKTETGWGLAKGVWKHVVYTQSDGVGKLYIDGVEVETRSEGKDLTAANTPKKLFEGESTAFLSIGRAPVSGDGYARARISDFRVYDGTLTAPEVTLLAYEQNKHKLEALLSDAKAYFDNSGSVDLGYEEAIRTALENAISEGNAASTSEQMNSAVVSLETAIKNCLSATYEIEENTLSAGDYYIKKAGTDSYWTNMKHGEATEAPEFQSLYPDNLKEQLWTITIDGSRYKIVNMQEVEVNGNMTERFIVEYGKFSSNYGYSSSWNTFNFHYNGDAYAVRRGGDAGNTYWRLGDDGVVIEKSETLNPATDFIFSFIDMPTALSDAVAVGTQKFNSAVKGNNVGQYLESVYNAFETALGNAQLVVNANNATSQDLIAYKAAEALFIPNDVSTSLDETFLDNSVVLNVEGNSLVISAKEETSVVIYSIEGKIINQFKVSDKESVYLPSGIYLVKTDKGVSKIII